MKQLENPDSASDSPAGDSQADSADNGVRAPSQRPFWLLFIVVVGVLAGGGYWGWQQLEIYRQALETRLGDLQSSIDERVTGAQLDQRVSPLRQSISSTDGRLGSLERQQQDLQASTEKLYELYGRDKNDWRLAEVEYLMSIAQHMLILEHDFEGAAKTLDGASDLIAEMADPGLLPVRVQISDEIAALKTRKRPDLVGMTLLLSRLSRQILHLEPGYQSKAVEEVSDTTPPQPINLLDSELPLDQRLMAFAKSLVSVNRSERVAEQPAAVVIDVGALLEDNLKLARWSLLDRDARQYRGLIDDSIELFKQYYDLDDAANADFHGSLVELSQASIKPDLPDISGSLRLLREIIKKRETLPQGGTGEVAEHG